MPSRPAGLVVAMCVALLVIGLAGCAVPRTPPKPESATRHLIAHALDGIANFYIEPVADRKLVLFGARNLLRLDGRLMVGESRTPGGGREFILTGDHKLLDTFVEPKDGNIRLWARLLARLVADAKAASTKLAYLPAERIDTAILDGFTGALDRFSRYSPPEEARLERALRDGFGGIGITLDDSKKGLVVTAVLRHGPADRAGLRPKDRILAIDGKPSSTLDEKAILAHLRGRVGTVLRLAVYRPDPPKKLRFRIKRGRIVPPSVKVSEANGILVFRIASFNKSTTALVAEKLLDSGPSHPKGIVLDLRGDPGGLLEQAVELVDLFLQKGPILATIGRNPLSDQYFVASGDSLAPDLPIVILIDGGSASSSEIVASALQDSGRAVVVGSSSYGKGTVQTVLTLPNRGTLTLTWARLITPEGYFLEAHGVVPNLCTSRLAGEGDHPARLIRQAQASGRLFTRPRGRLNEAGWKTLRRSCPKRTKGSPIDLELAQRLLSDPPLYQRALRLVAAAPLKAPVAAAGNPSAEGSALTRSGALLFFVRHRP